MEKNKSMRNYLKGAKSFIFLLSALCFSASLLASEYIVKYKNKNTFHNNFITTYQLNSLELKDKHDEGLLHLVKVSDSVAKVAIDELRKNSNIEYVVENIKIEISSTLTNDPKINEQWSLKKVNAKKAWGFTPGDPSVVVAVIDTGVDWKHQDLQVSKKHL